MSKMKNLFSALSENAQTKLLSGKSDGNQFLRKQPDLFMVSTPIRHIGLDQKKAAANDNTLL
jgi:hypothetical protein